MTKDKFLVGTEMAHTNFNGLHTLFVSGFAYAGTLLELCKEHNVKHVHLGYNNTFQNNKMYNQIIDDLFEAGLKVTLEYPASEYKTIMDLIVKEIWDNRNFVPLMTVEVGDVYLRGHNSSVQFVDSKSANAGVWSSKFTSVMDHNNYESMVDINNRISAVTSKETETAKVAPQTEEPTTVTVEVSDAVKTVVVPAATTKPAPATGNKRSRGPNKVKTNG